MTGWKIEHKSLKTIYKLLGLEEQGKVQKYLDKKVVETLQRYVSRNSGIQEKSIPIASKYGSGKVIINVPYAQFQAGGKVMIGIYSHSPWARRGEKKILTSRDLKYHGGALRGKHPFERMKADKRESILNETANYARRISGG